VALYEVVDGQGTALGFTSDRFNLSGQGAEENSNRAQRSSPGLAVLSHETAPFAMTRNSSTRSCRFLGASYSRLGRATASWPKAPRGLAVNTATLCPKNSPFSALLARCNGQKKPGSDAMDPFLCPASIKSQVASVRSDPTSSRDPVGPPPRLDVTTANCSSAKTYSSSARAA